VSRWLLVAASEQRAAIDSGELSIADLVDASLQRIAETQEGAGAINAVTSYDRGYSEDQVAQAEDSFSEGEPGALLGIPVALKDNICTSVLPTTCASRALREYVSPYDATVVKRLRESGAIIVAKTNMDEFAMGSSTETSAFGPTRNPADLRYVPGGSSGGSAAAVAAGICRIALGSDTAGSTRQPASFCGVVGVKPTYGRVSRFGLVALASSLDQVGVFGATVGDAALALCTIAGRDPLDSTSADLPVPVFAAAREESVSGLVVGVPKEYFPEDLHPGVRECCTTAIELLRGSGAVIREISLPNTVHAVPVYHVIAAAEASSNLARFHATTFGPRRSRDGSALPHGRDFGVEVVRRLLLGTHFLSTEEQPLYRKAMQVRTLVAGDFTDAFGGGVDLIFSPTTPTPAFELGGRTTAYSMYESDAFTVAANLAGLPAISLPVGSAGGLPIGGQIIAPHFAEQRMFAAAFALERALGADAIV
jgi:aspartyl-tRNA(Asn)/glutamyl-tRNA(Gln) amidotransferase subunit A